MNNKIKILGIALVAVLALTALGAGVAFAKNQFSNNQFGPGWMMGGNAQTEYGPGMMGDDNQNDGGWDWMDAMHQWMNADGGMHTFIWNTLTEKLGMTSNELYTEVSSGKTIVQIAEEKGISRADLVAALETAHKASLAQAVHDGYLTQQQADNFLAQMAGNYGWMIDNAGIGYVMMGGYSGQQGSNNQFVPGGCHGNWNGSAASQTTMP
jgi:hypothetical protein